MVIDEDDYEDRLAHYGTPRHSGRYPWGSGGNDPSESHKGNRNPDDPSDHHPSNPIPNNAHLLDYVQNMKRQGLKESQIAEGMGLTVAQLRAKQSIARAESQQAKITEAMRLKYDKGMSNTAAAEQMGIPESTFRTLLAPNAMERAMAYRNTADVLKAKVDEVKFLDVGTGVPNYLKISDEKLRASIAILEEEGYQVHTVPMRVTSGFDTKRKILVPPGVTNKEAWLNRYNVQQLDQVSGDGGLTYSHILPPISVDPKRVKVVYGDEGGRERDGVIHVREGVSDVSLGKSRYAQVRVKVGDDHYMKGMAHYKEDLPDGVDLVFHTNKKNTGNKLDALKAIESDSPDFPFGTVIKNQIQDNPGTEHAKVTSAMNIVNEQGDWIKWNRNISAQALSKQDPRVAKRQLDMTFEQRQAEFNDIKGLTNATVRKKFLEDFADSTDSASVHLKAAGFERQNWHVILPIESLRPNHVYAPNFNDGENVVLIRYPHGGTFEIPELVVNNKNREAKRAFGDRAFDAIGIHHTVAERLSGADFDGDTVLVIPNDDRKISSKPALERLKGFDAKERYKLPEGQKFTGNKQHLMGDVSNLITDMTIKKAPNSEIVRAVMHSMVVIDAEKHDLNHKQSAIDFNIKELKQKYQAKFEGDPRPGASTIISRAKSEKRVPDRKLRLAGEGGPIDPVTGAKVFVPTNAMVTNKAGVRVPKMIKTKRLAEEPDARMLLSGPNHVGTPIEVLYANHSNKLKGLANKSRLEWYNTPTPKQVGSAAKVYASEVASLNAKLDDVQRRRPLERQAQAIAQQAISAKRQANTLTSEQLKKLKYQEQTIARTRMGLTKGDIHITDREWAAIQAGAISNNKLEQILDKADMDRVRELATPQHQQAVTTAMRNRALDMLSKGYSQAEVAQAVGVSISSLNRALTPTKDEIEEEEG